MHPLQLSKMSAIPTAVHQNRCLLQRNSEAKCKYCLEACPNNAIKIDKRAPSVNINLCSGCGLCLVACPVECFETGSWTERSVVSTLAHSEETGVEIACKTHPAPEVGHNSAQIIQISTCLGAVSPGLWFETGLGYIVKLRMEYCSDCPMQKGASYAVRSIELANLWLTSCGGAINTERSIFITEAREDSEASQSRKVISEGPPTLSRRDFLFGFARSSGPTKLALNNLLLQFGSKDTEHKMAPHLPAWLLRLSEIYPETQKNITDEGCSESQEEKCINWPTLSVGDDCAACRSCSVNCPSGALQTKVIDGQYQHLFTPGFCVACGLCAQVCPAEALTRNYSFDDRPFSERVVAERQVTKCSKCERPALKKADPLCYCCANEPKINSVMDSARGYLFRN